MSTRNPGEFIRDNWRQIIIGFFTLLIIVIPVFNLGGDDFVSLVNNNISSFEALTILIVSILLWVRMGEKSQNRLLWIGLTIGWGLWTIAEWAWGIASFSSAEPPFPSIADFFWLIGYIPMFIALDARNRSIPEETTAKQKLIIWISSIVAVGLTAIFILVPVITSYEPGALFQTIVTLFYPVGDLILFVMVLRIAFKYQQGLNGKAWNWISLGYILLTVADLIFCYASANNIYYPNNEVNFISSFSDTLYSVSYMVILFGLAFMRQASNLIQPTEQSTLDFPHVKNTHVLFFTDRGDLINDVSKNYPEVFGPLSVIGQTISYAVGLPFDAAARLTGKLKSQKVLMEEPFMITTQFGQENALLSGETLITPEGGYSGSIILLRLFLEDYAVDSINSDYHRSIIRSLLKKTGDAEEKEIVHLHTVYYSALLKEFIEIVETEGGNILGHSVSGKLQTIADESNWKIDISLDGTLDTGNLPLEEAKKSLLEVIGEAKKITAEITDEETVHKAEKNLWDKLDLKTREGLLQFGVSKPDEG
jgi:hypothetical protein